MGQHQEVLVQSLQVVHQCPPSPAATRPVCGRFAGQQLHTGWQHLGWRDSYVMVLPAPVVLASWLALISLKQLEL